jgi:hypothetical protein
MPLAQRIQSIPLVSFGISQRKPKGAKRKAKGAKGNTGFPDDYGEGLM